MSVRTLLKTAAEHVLAGIGDLQRRRRLRGQSVILAYHNVVPTDHPSFGDRPGHLDLDAFRRQLDVLAQYYDIVSLDEAVTPSESDRPRAALTFDDAYSGTIEHAWSELSMRGLPATCFVSPAFVNGGIFWWDALAQPSGHLDPAVREHVLTPLQGSDAAAREWAKENGWPVANELPSDYRVASVDQLGAAVNDGLRLGSHSWGHRALPTLNPEQLTPALERPLTWLRKHFGDATIGWLAYPYGHYSPEVGAAAARAGYVGALLADGGLFRPGQTDPFAVPRLTIPAGLSIAGFRLRLLGFLT